MTGKQNKGMLLIILVLTIAASIVAFLPRFKTAYGLDIQGGVRVVLRAKTEEYKGGKWSADKLEAVRHIMENRINSTGVSEPLLITKQPDQVIVELPGLKNEKEAIAQISSTARLDFYVLPQLGDKDGNRTAIWKQVTLTDPKTLEKTEVLVDIATNRPLTPEQLETAVFSREPVVTGKDMLPTSRAEIQASTSSAVIDFAFNEEGSKAFEQATRANIGKFLAIFLDKKLLTAPSINSVIPGRGIIEGNFTLESAKALSDQLNAGALPVPLVIEETRKLEATLGKEAVAATTRAGIIGLLLVLGFMLFWYRLPGLLADVALVLYTVFSFALFKLIGVTLTLPGIAGFILSIGMAVDANILIFERVKEELRSGKTLRTSIDVGFKRAFTAIFDSNVCTILTCGVLYYFGTGPIRGFALTLGLGVAVSMFTAITATRTFLFALVGMNSAQNASLYGVAHQWTPDLKVMSRKFLWLGLSTAVIVPGMIFWGMGGIKKSIDFRGGTEIRMPFAERHTSDQIQKALVQVNRRYADSRVVVSSDPSASAKLAYITTEKLSDTERIQIVDALVKNVGALTPGTALTDVGYDNVSGTISGEMTWNAILAVIYASVLIVLYLAFRFSIGGFFEGLKYGTCAVVALLHDVLVVWGSFAFLGWWLNWQVDSLFVTAMLTVIGFSVHDTIIVFDRVRENLQHRVKGETFSQITDRSIDQTISRSVKTSFTVVLTLSALFIAGGAGIHQFSAALLIGIISGTYSSIFNASVLLVMWKQHDIGLGLPSVSAAAAPRSGVRAKTLESLPGDRPMVSPGKTEIPQSDSGTGQGEASNSGERSTSSPGAAPRRQPVRRRRM